MLSSQTLPKDFWLDFCQSSLQVHDKVRALSPIGCEAGSSGLSKGLWIRSARACWEVVQIDSKLEATPLIIMQPSFFRVAVFVC